MERRPTSMFERGLMAPSLTGNAYRDGWAVREATDTARAEVARFVAERVGSDRIATDVAALGPAVGGQFSASFDGDGMNGLLVVSLDGWDAAGDYTLFRPQESVTGSLRHEIIHALRTLGAIPAERWAILSRRGKKLRDRHNIDRLYARDYRQMLADPGQRAFFAQKYGIDATDPQATEALLDEMLLEEAVAEEYSRYRESGKASDPLLTRLFDALSQLFERIGNALRGQGFQSAQDVFGEIEAGAFAGASGGAGRGAAGSMDQRAENPQTQTEAFKRWFGDSKVVDENGDPLVVYHGTKADFDVFDASLSGQTDDGWLGDGLYFHTDPENASTYATEDGYRPSPGGNVLPVFLSIKNPLRVTRAEDGRIGRYRELGFDGIFWHENGLSASPTEIVAFSPTQIKSATGNRGTFDPANASIMEQRRENTGRLIGNDIAAPRRSVIDQLMADDMTLIERVKAATSREAVSESVDRWRYNFQDRFLDLKRMQRKIGEKLGREIAEGEDPYRAEELMSGRIGARLEQLSEESVRPLVKDIQTRLGDAKVRIVYPEGEATLGGLELLEEYLYARHAPERNKRIAEINPEFAEGEGSGMTNDEAAAVLAAVEKSGKQGDLQALADQVYGMLRQARQTRVQAGLMTQEQADAWEATYASYVPLRGRAELDPELEAERPNLGGAGLTVRGPESKRAFGRRSKASNLLAHSIMQAQEAIVRAERNAVGQALYNLVKAMPDTDLWTADKVEVRPVWVQASQQVEYRPVAPVVGPDADYTVSLKIDGQPHRVTFNRENPMGQRLGDSMRNLSGQDFKALVGSFGKINRFLSAVNTTFNPEFVIVNAFRDVQTATANIAQYDIDGLITGTLRDYPSALKASVKGAFGKGDGEWANAYREFVQSGGRVYFNNVEDISTLRKKLMNDLNDAKGGFSTRRAVATIGNTIESINLGVENAVRLSAFKNARAAGMSRSQAASLAKNLTVNFNRRGKFGPVINSLYLFYNASIQGSATMLTALKHRKVQQIAGAGVLVGAVVEIMNIMASGEDDDGELYYDKISDFDKQRNLIIMIPGSEGKFFKIPLPYGYNVFPALGRSVVEAARGKSASKVAADFAITVLEAFNPIGGAGNLLNLIAPTIADPFVDLERNRDFADRPIMPEQSQYGTPVPDAQRYWNSVSPTFRWITDGLTFITGGDNVKPGMVDVSPETLEYLFGVVIGAAGAFYERNATTVVKLFDPASEVSFNDFSFFRKVVGQKPGWYDKAAFYERSGEIEQAAAYVKRYAEAGDKKAALQTRQENRDLLRLAPLAKETREGLSAIGDARGRAAERYDAEKLSKDAYRAELDRLKKREEWLLTNFNKAYLDGADRR